MSSRSKAFNDGVPRSDRKRLVELAQLIPDQATLNTILLDVANQMQRGAVYDIIKPHLKFSGDYPAWVANYRAKKVDIVAHEVRRQDLQKRADRKWTH